MPCNQIAAFVIYDLPGRDCAAKASNGELPVGSIETYKKEYIDRESFNLWWKDYVFRITASFERLC